MFDTGFDKNVEQTTKKPSKPVSDVFFTGLWWSKECNDKIYRSTIIIPVIIIINSSIECSASSNNLCFFCKCKAFQMMLEITTNSV